MASISRTSMRGNWNLLKLGIPEDSLKKRILSLPMNGLMMRTIFKTSRKVIFRFNLSNCTSICLPKSGVVFAVILFFVNPLWGQKVIGLSTQYDDRFDKWIIVTDVEGLE